MIIRNKCTLYLEIQTFFCHLPSGIVRDWLLSLSDGRKRVRSLKLQLFCTLAGLLPSVATSVTGERLSFSDVCLLLMLWPRGLAMRTRSLKLSFWLHEVRRTVEGERVRKKEYEKNNEEENEKEREKSVKYSSISGKNKWLIRVMIF